MAGTKLPPFSQEWVGSLGVADAQDVMAARLALHVEAGPVSPAGLGAPSVGQPRAVTLRPDHAGLGILAAEPAIRVRNLLIRDWAPARQAAANPGGEQEGGSYERKVDR
jgi:hypothetical protein